jgi:hypothetical protein
MSTVKFFDQHARSGAIFFGMLPTDTGRGMCPACDSHMLLTVPKKRSTVNAVQITPKQHKRRRNQTEAYHKKVQKRWDKRSKTDPRFQISGKHQVIVVDTSVLNRLAAPYGASHA